jgi:hypothetical protein
MTQKSNKLSKSSFQILLNTPVIDLVVIILILVIVIIFNHLIIITAENVILFSSISTRLIYVYVRLISYLTLCSSSSTLNCDCIHSNQRQSKIKTDHCCVLQLRQLPSPSLHCYCWLLSNSSTATSESRKLKEIIIACCVWINCHHSIIVVDCWVKTHRYHNEWGLLFDPLSLVSPKRKLVIWFQYDDQYLSVPGPTKTVAQLVLTMARIKIILEAAMEMHK